MLLKGQCKIVYIPADTHRPIEERVVQYTEDDEVGCVQNLAKAHFRAHKPVKTAAQKAAQTEALLAQVPEDQREGLSDQLMTQALDMGMVEHLALLSNAVDSQFIGVTFYCDDEATALELPMNVRASQITACAGKPTEVRGDVFVARVLDNEENFQRLDFTSEELSSSAPWIKQAAAQNERKRKGESAEAKLKKIGKASKTPKKADLSPAEAKKTLGNEAFQQEQYSLACKHYSAAIELDSNFLAAYNNRAMARLKLSDWQGALEDTQFVLAREVHNVKALLRQATAQEGLQQTGEARASYELVLQIEPRNGIALLKTQQLR